MATTVSAATWQCNHAATITNSTGARHSFAKNFSHTLKDSNGDYLFDRVFALTDYSLAVGTLDIDLYDLGTLDLGAGAGEDNLGLSHANARIIAMAFRNQVTGNAGVITIDSSGLGASNWDQVYHDSSQFTFAEGAFRSDYFGESGKTVTDTTSHQLRLVASVATCVIDLVFYSAQS